MTGAQRPKAQAVPAYDQSAIAGRGVFLRDAIPKPAEDLFICSTDNIRSAARLRWSAMKHESTQVIGN